MIFYKNINHSLSKFPLEYIFDWIVRIFLVFIPFASFVSVFFVYKLGFPGAPFIKEILLLLAGISLFLIYIRSYFSSKKYRIQLTTIDILILTYIAVMVGITIPTTGISGIIYGGRYDFAFLIAFLIAYHGFPFLSKPMSYYLRIFLISSGVMLFFSALLKWPFTEDLLLYFGYSGNPSAWDFGSAPPIFHGIADANVRRFQGILDGPNTMGAFLIIFSGLLAYFTRFRREWYFVIAIILVGLLGMVFYTYSRSAMLGLLFAYTMVVVFSLRSLWSLYRMQLVSAVLILGLLIAGVGVIYYDKAASILGRAGSTQGHHERMMVGVERVQMHPLGQGLGSAGPAYRHVLNLTNTDELKVIESDRFYIPESWYIQQFIEGGILGGILFLALMAMIFFALTSLHPILGALFAGVGIMNLFLHTFESSVVSLSLFMIVGLLLAYKKHVK